MLGRWMIGCALLAACGGQAPEPERAGADGPIAALRELIGSEPGVLEYVEVDDLGTKHRGRRVRVHGHVTDGAIMRSGDGSTHRFEIRGEQATLAVEHQGVLPDRFQAKLEVVLTGTLADDGKQLRSDDLVAKCPSSYDAAPAP